MAYPTKAQWADAFGATYAMRMLGEKYIDSAPIVQAFGVPQRVAPGNMLQPWTDGGTADYVLTSAGAGQASGVAPAQGSSATISPALVGGQAYTDIWSEALADGFDLSLSMKTAFNDINHKVVAGAIGAGAGSANSIQGVRTHIQRTAPAALGLKFSGSTVETNLDDAFDQVIAKLPSTGYTIAIGSDGGEVDLVKRLKAAGGITPNHLAEEAFGQPMLTYRNVLFFSNHGVSDTYDAGGSFNARMFYFFNIGPDGCMVVQPNTLPGFKVKMSEPEKTFRTTYDIALAWQLLYTSPSAAAVLYWDY